MIESSCGSLIEIREFKKMWDNETQIPVMLSYVSEIQ